MERKKYFILILAALIVSAMAHPSNKEDIYKAYISNDMEEWKSIIDKMQKQSNNSNSVLIELVNYQYGYIGWCIGTDRKKEAKKYLALAEDNLDILEDANFNPSEINGYKSAFYGFKIGLSPMRAPLLGPKSVKHSKLSMQQNEKNPMGYIQYGNSQYYMPPVFGGSKQEAVNYFKKALDLMENDPEQTKNNWNHLSLLTLIARSFEEMEEFDKAEMYYQKILGIEPNFVYVADELYPEFLKKKRNE